MAAHPEDLPADVGDPLLFQGVALGVLDQVGDRSGAAELHDQLRRHTWSVGDIILTQICSKQTINTSSSLHFFLKRRPSHHLPPHRIIKVINATNTLNRRSHERAPTHHSERARPSGPHEHGGWGAPPAQVAFLLWGWAKVSSQGK